LPRLDAPPSDGVSLVRAPYFEMASGLIRPVPISEGTKSLRIAFSANPPARRIVRRADLTLPRLATGAPRRFAWRFFNETVVTKLARRSIPARGRISLSRASLIEVYIAALPLAAVAIVSSADGRRCRIETDGEPAPGETIERRLYFKPSHAELVLSTIDLEGWTDQAPAANRAGGRKPRRAVPHTSRAP
jgi:hypothetical protein